MGLLVDICVCVGLRVGLRAWTVSSLRICIRAQLGRASRKFFVVTNLVRFNPFAEIFGGGGDTKENSIARAPVAMVD
jgi:hypothetical protein